VTTIGHHNNMPRDVARSPSLEVLKTQADMVPDHLIWAPLPTRGWTRWSFEAVL